MGGRGPTRKDPAVRVRARDHNPKQLLDAVGGQLVAPEEHPEPPDGLLQETLDRWTAFWDSPVAALIDRTSDLPALHRLFELYDDATRYRMQIREAAMVRGSKGQWVRNPFVKDLKDTNSAILALEDRFGLSPRARLSLNLSLVGAAKTYADLNENLGVGDYDDDDPRFDANSIEGEYTSETVEPAD